VIIIAVGSWTLVHGGYRALRQYDLKLVLAFGTVSQLGLLVLLVGLGNRAAALAGLAMIGAHAMFKASLFLTVGVVDAATGTRDLRRLTGVGRALPVTATVGALATASMIGLPPFAGYVAKEAALEALLPDAGTGVGVGVLVAMVVGSAFTVAYGLRFWWGAFGPAVVGVVPQAEPEEPVTISRPTPVLVAPAAVLALLGLATALVPSLGEDLLSPHAATYPGEPGHLTLWAGVGPALGLTAAVLVLGGLLFAQRVRVEQWQHRVPLRADADLFYRRMMRKLDVVAADVTAVTQRGSEPFYLGVILIVLSVLVVGALATGTAVPAAGDLRPWDTGAQLVAGGLSATAAVLAARSRRRLKAVILAGISGYGVAMLFLLHGAPDLALTQVLVETITLVVLVLVLRRLPPYFSVRPLAASRWVRLAIGASVGLGVGALAILAPLARTATPVSVDFPREATAYGGGKNIVNVTLVDIRAWDTMGEISVLLVAATGVASLIFLRRRSGEILRSRDVTDGGVVWGDVADPMAALRFRGFGGSGRASEWLRAGRTLAPQRRSIIFEIAVRLLFHSMIVVAVFLLFSGHNSPGGGFAAGLVVGIALIVRYLAGGRYELGEAAPVHPGLLLGSGLFLSAGVGLVALIAGGSVLQSVIVEVTVPVLGHIKLVTSLFFDLGVFLVVIGLVLDVLRSLGAEIDRHADEDSSATGEISATDGRATAGGAP
jgi:multicomponent Na+:H+ antiporter subunit A